MGIQIERIGIKEIGPLKPGVINLRKVNLFYGHNETGKTLLVEFLYRSLFRNQALALRKASGTGGQVAVSGLDAGEVLMNPGKSAKKLEDWLPVRDGGLPRDFSRLLVVKSGELDLAENTAGVDDAILKQFLSGEGLLDEISSRIEPAAAKADFVDGVITGSTIGLVKNYKTKRADLDRLDEIIHEVELKISSGERSEISGMLAELEAKMAIQQKARRHRAYQLDARLQELAGRLAALPKEEIDSLKRSFLQLEQTHQDLIRERDDLARNEKLSEHYEWLDGAGQVYRELLMREQQQQAPQLKAWLAVAALFLLLIVPASFLPSPYNLFAMSLSVLMAGLTGYLSIRAARQPMQDDTRKAEMNRIENEYRGYFKDPGPVSLAKMDTRRKELEKPYNNSLANRERMHDLQQRHTRLQAELRAGLRSLAGKPVSAEKTQEQLIEIENTRENLAREYQRVETELARLNIEADGYLAEPAEEEYNPARWFELENQISDARDRLQDIDREQIGLKSKAAGVAGQYASVSWEVILGKLDELRKETAAQCRELKAELLAKIALTRVLNGLRELESSRIDAGLRNEKVGSALLAATGRYNRIERQNGQLVVSDDFNEFPLEILSTGAREQVLLGLRLGFAARLLEGQPLFLILDDAFQHSDWERRRRLVKRLFELAGNGWQILYFSMDDHIRGLFEEYSVEAPQDYQTIPLAIR